MVVVCPVEDQVLVGGNNGNRVPTTDSPDAEDPTVGGIDAENLHVTGTEAEDLTITGTDAEDTSQTGTDAEGSGPILVTGAQVNLAEARGAVDWVVGENLFVGRDDRVGFGQDVNVTDSSR